MADGPTQAMSSIQASDLAPAVDAAPNTQYPMWLKSQAKALVILCGNADTTLEIIKEHNPWPDHKVPDRATLYRWNANPMIPVDLEFAATVTGELRTKVMYWVGKLLDPVGEAIEARAIAAKDDVDTRGLGDLVKAFTFLGNMAQPAGASPYGQGPVVGNQTNIGHQANTYLLYGPKSESEMKDIKDSNAEYVDGEVVTNDD